MSDGLQKPEQLCHQSQPLLQADPSLCSSVESQNPRQNGTAKEKAAKEEERISELVDATNSKNDNDSTMLNKDSLLPVQTSSISSLKEHKLPKKQSCPNAAPVPKVKSKRYRGRWGQDWLKRDDQSFSQQIAGQAQDIEEEEMLENSSSSSDSDNEEPHEDIYPTSYDSEEDTNFDKYFQQTSFLLNQHQQHQAMFRTHADSDDEQSIPLLPIPRGLQIHPGALQIRPGALRIRPAALPMDEIASGQEIFQVLNRSYLLRLQRQGGRGKGPSQEACSQSESSKSKETSPEKARRVVFSQEVQVKDYKQAEEVTLVASTRQSTQQLNHHEKSCHSTPENHSRLRPLQSEPFDDDDGELRGSYQEELRKKCLSILKAECPLYKPPALRPADPHLPSQQPCCHLDATRTSEALQRLAGQSPLAEKSCLPAEQQQENCLYQHAAVK